MAEITKIYGIPGSGKTTWLVNKIAEYNFSGTPIWQISYVTFSKSAAVDALERIGTECGVENEDLKHLYFGTVHSICYRLLGGGLKLAQHEDRAKYLEGQGLKYPDKFHNSTDLPDIALPTETNDITDEEKIFSIINLCNHRCIPLKNWRSLGIVLEHIPPSFVEELCKGWLGYKNQKGLVDFDDMLLDTIELGLAPPVDILFVDEFQDFTPLLYRVFKSWSKKIYKIYVAGDDDQTIYSFAGASPNHLLKLKGNTIILDKSYRVPKNILQPAQRVIETVRNRQKKRFKTHIEGGEFLYLQKPTFEEILKNIDTEKINFILGRTNRIAGKFCWKYLVPNGVPFIPLNFSKPNRQSFIPDIWLSIGTDIRDAHVRYFNGHPLTQEDIKQLKKTYPGFKRNKQRRLIDSNNREGLASQPCLESPYLLKALGSTALRDAFRANVNSIFQSVKPPYIRIGTLHCSKGLQANNVFVFNNHSRPIEQALVYKGRSVIDAEKRLYFVGMTRAMEKLVFVNDFFNTYSFDLGGVLNA